MSRVSNRVQRTTGWFSFDGPPTYRDAWRVAAGLSVVGAAYAAVYGLLGDGEFGAFVGLAVPLVAVAFTLGVAVERREARHAALSLAVLVAWGAVAWLLGPVGTFVRENRWFGLFFGWLVVLFALLGYAAPGLARTGGE